MLTINLPELGIGKTAYTVKTITQTLKAYNFLMVEHFLKTQQIAPPLFRLKKFRYNDII